MMKSYRLEEKYLQTTKSNKVLISNKYKNPLQIQPLKKSNQIMDKSRRETFLLREYTDGKQAHEKMFNITSHQRKAN